MFNLQIPILFIAVKGCIERYAFIDENGNGECDPNELGVPDLILTLGNTQARTDLRGSELYRFFPMQPGRYFLSISNLPADLHSAVLLPIQIDLNAGEIKKVDIPVARATSLGGVVFNDANWNGVQDPSEDGLARVRLVLSGHQGQMSAQATTADGSFVFCDLTPGDYTVVVSSP